ncbi:enoyl-CoA hydratase-related protein [Nocardiopsis changdeensis]|uniref:enoyl-CoA hydratase-related protein n=1 Tax=Nocardiopsis changdeensis TaxID=2831969 RepID=UPI003F48C4B3
MTAPTSGEGRVLTRFDGPLAHVTLDNPRRRNAITLSMARDLVRFCERVERDTVIGAVVVDAVGDYFCSGADTRDLADASADPASPEAVRRISAVYDSFVRIGNLPVPSVCLVAGGAVGAGLNLALATDLMLVTPDAVLDSGFLARRIHPGGGHLSLLGSAAGRGPALAMGLFGAALTGEEAVRRGLAWEQAPADELPALAGRLTAAAVADPELARRIKESARLELGPPGVPWPAALEIERGAQMWSMRRKGEAAWAARARGAGEGHR